MVWRDSQIGNRRKQLLLSREENSGNFRINCRERLIPFSWISFIFEWCWCQFCNFHFTLWFPDMPENKFEPIQPKNCEFTLTKSKYSSLWNGFCGTNTARCKTEVHNPLLVHSQRVYLRLFECAFTHPPPPPNFEDVCVYIVVRIVLFHVLVKQMTGGDKSL